MTDHTKSQVLQVVSYVILALIGYMWVSNDTRRAEEHRQFLEAMAEMRDDIDANRDATHRNALDIKELE